MKSGDIFWARSEGIADEEQGHHPWIVISKKALARCGLVIAVPITSNPTRYKTWDVYMAPGEITCADGVFHSLDPKKLDGVVKCAKLRHWSVERIDEVVGSATTFFVNKLRRVVLDALGYSRIR